MEAETDAKMFLILNNARRVDSTTKSLLCRCYLPLLSRFQWRICGEEATQLQLDNDISSDSLAWAVPKTKDELPINH